MDIKKKWVVMGKLKLLSIIMSVLIVSIPLHSAYVLGRINSVKVYNKDGLEGYLAESGDYLEIVATVESEIAASNLRTDYPSNTVFDECHAEAGSYVCTYKSGEADMSSRAYEFTVMQYDDNGLQVDKKDSVFYVDGDKPRVDDVQASQDGDVVSFSYQVSDSACEGCVNKCSGLASLQIYEDSTIIDNLDINTTYCTYDGSGEVETSKLGVQTGKTTICVTAADNIGLESSKKCKSLDIDAEGPYFDGRLFSLVDKEGDNITYVPSLPLEAKVSIGVSDPNINIGSIKADLSKLNTVLPDKYKDISGSCTASGDYYICEWDVLIDMASGNLNLFFEASDNKGNTETFSKAITLVQDSTPPVIGRVYTNPLAEGDALYLTSGLNIVTVQLDGSGSGYDKEQVYLDLTGIGGQPDISPEECTQQGGDWRCVYEVSIRKDHWFEGYISVSAKDDAGNKQTDDYKVIFDNMNPEISDITLSSECAIASEGLIVDVSVQDDMQVSISIDASDISTSGRGIQGDCEEESTGNYLCSFMVSGLYTVYTKGNIRMNITDAAGNTVKKAHSVEICEEEAGVEPNLASVQVGDINPIDKRLLSFLGTTVYVPMYFRTSATIIRKTVSCQGSSGDHFLNEDSKTSTLVAKINQQSFGEDEDELIIDCTIDLILKKGRKVYSTPETETVNISIPLYNLALGEISESMERKIEGLDDDIADLQEEINKWEQWNKWLNMLCSMAESLSKINSLLQSVKEVIWAITCTAYTACIYPVCECCSPMSKLWTYTCKPITYFNSIVERFVWPTGFDLGFSIGNVVKYGCMLYSCRLCDWSNVINVGVTATAAAFMPKTIETTRENYGGGEWSIKDGEVAFKSGIEYNLPRDSFSFVDTKQISYKSRWSEAAKHTMLSDPRDSESWIYDPYKSIHYSKICLCLPGYIYNLRKDRQIKCWYKTCLEENTRVGLPTDTCDIGYKERECLYVDSAQYKEHGYLPDFDNLIDTLVQMLPGIIVGIAYSVACLEYRNDYAAATCGTGTVEPPCVYKPNAACGLISAATAIIEIADIMDGGLDFSKYDTTLDGTDYCSGGAE